MRAVPEPFRLAATETSQRILVDPARWMRGPDPVGLLGALQAAVFTAAVPGVAGGVGGGG